MRTLDHLLYAWLAESDEQRFKLAFNAYFIAAFPATVRHLARLSRWRSEQLEDIAQEAMLQFFDRVGRGRRAAAQATAEALTRIRPLNLGAIHERQVHRWIDSVSAFRAESLGVKARLDAQQPDPAGAIRSLAEQVPRLQAEGHRLLHAVALAVHPRVGVTDEIVRVGEGESSDCAQWLAAEVRREGASALAAERRLPGVQRFTIDVYAIIEALPLLQAPTNGFLFEIAASRFFDESRRRGRLKRGGAGKPVSAVSDVDSRQPLELLSIDRAEDTEDDLSFKCPSATRLDTNVSTLGSTAFDPAHTCENEDFFERFCAYLRQPLENAAQAFDCARLSGHSNPESARRKLESLTDKFSRTMAVLSLLGEGYSQQQTAEQLGLSRNQVKYIVEIVQAAYASFAMGSGSAASSSLIREDARG